MLFSKMAALFQWPGIILTTILGTLNFSIHLKPRWEAADENNVFPFEGRGWDVLPVRDMFLSLSLPVSETEKWKRERQSEWEREGKRVRETLRERGGKYETGRKWKYLGINCCWCYVWTSFLWIEFTHNLSLDFPKHFLSLSLTTSARVTTFLDSSAKKSWVG